jgi:two-component system, sensor histidine kinase YesM
MGAVSRGDLAVRAEPQQIAELAELTQGFNTMVQRIDELGAARERSERERLAVELDALRYQINPHFVANTLNAIRFTLLGVWVGCGSVHAGIGPVRYGCLDEAP